MVKNVPVMQEIWVRFLGQEDPLEKRMATHSSILAWKIPRMEEPGGLQSLGSQRVRHDWTANTHHICRIWKNDTNEHIYKTETDWQTSLSMIISRSCRVAANGIISFFFIVNSSFCIYIYIYIFIYQRRQWHPTPVLLPGKSHGWRSLVGCSLWGC